ncbi:MAG: Uma2 family endonuclease [Rhodothermales bacterium]
MEAKKIQHLSLTEYTAIEQETGIRYEFHDGHIYAMAGGTLNHGLICGNIFGELRSSLQGADCTALSSEIKLRIAQTNSYVYPDAMAVCGGLEAEKEEIGAISNPTVIVEVLSKTSSNYDRGDKFYFYRTIESLQQYVLIEQEKALVEVFSRKAGLWEIRRFAGMEQNLELHSLDRVIPLALIYQSVSFKE